jgi:phospholipase/carboxylesterase
LTEQIQRTRVAGLRGPFVNTASGNNGMARLPHGDESAAAMTGDIGSGAKQGRLLARPGSPPQSWHPCVRPLGLGQRRDGLLMLPEVKAAPLPMLLLLHGAGGTAEGMLRILEPRAREAGVALLVPKSRGPTWDVIMESFGPDVAFLDAALSHAFKECPVDPGKIAIGGFSDGASYALSLGLANGDLFRRILAFSPGFAVPPGAVGMPAIYISHGTEDDVLPIDRCSRRLVPRLRQHGYDLRYDEFKGGHFVPDACIAASLALLNA